MSIGDYDSVTAMMKKTDGVTFRDADSREATQRYLLRNPGLSFVALEGEHIVGCIMSGHDGRRGYLQHLVVLPTHRKRGIASAWSRAAWMDLKDSAFIRVTLMFFRRTILPTLLGRQRMEVEDGHSPVFFRALWQ
jgi:ribosomal protein S18 acetylase RimI-like enzyme